MTTVVNKNLSPYDVYCGRGSIFGNPYVIGKDGTRDQVIDRYKEWFNFLLRDPSFVLLLHKLKDKRLGCFCKQPNIEVRCHCDIIADYVNGLPKN
jgi:Domain of unknown function (DUF4326)